MMLKTPGRLLAVGDIHGQCEKLKALMKEVHPVQEDQVVFLGDYIDRGPDARGVIDFLLDFQKRFPRTVFLRGNHEQMFLDYLDLEGQDGGLYIQCGGGPTLESYEAGGTLSLPDTHREFLETLPLLHETDDFIFVHAGLRPGLSLDEQDPDDLLWIRGEFLHSSYSWGKPVVHGHTPQPAPSLHSEYIGLDTGAGHGGPLTCCDLRSGSCWSA